MLTSFVVWTFSTAATSLVEKSLPFSGKGASQAEERGDSTNGAGSKRKDGRNGGTKSDSSLLNNFPLDFLRKNEYLIVQ